MKLFCEKHKESMDSDNARCVHPTEYCKFRTACIIHFMGRENGDRKSGGTENAERDMELLQFNQGRCAANNRTGDTSAGG